MDSQTLVVGQWRSSAISTPKLDAALAAAQGEIEAAPKDANNPHFNRSYADLSAIIGVARLVLSRHKIARYQAVWTDDKPGVVITTRLACEGEWVEADLRMPVDKNNAQAVGSATTYGKRYGLSAMLGIATQDDDGEQAAAAPPAARSTPRPRGSQPRDRDNEPEQETSPVEPTDALGPRCTGKAAGIAKANGERMRDLLAVRGGKASELWADVLVEAGVDVSKYGKTPRAETLTVVDGQTVRDYLIRVLEPTPADMEALRTEASKLWVQLCKGPDGYRLDDWQASYASFAGVKSWPDQPTAADYRATNSGMRAEIAKMNT